MGCKGICNRYKAKRSISEGRYRKGQKRCQVCEIYILCDRFFCPCCGCRLRTKPRNKVYKEKLMEFNSK